MSRRDNQNPALVADEPVMGRTGRAASLLLRVIPDRLYAHYFSHIFP
jgi:hypothetical protein